MANIKLLWHCGEAVWETRRDYKAISPTASQPASSYQPTTGHVLWKEGGGGQRRGRNKGREGSENGGKEETRRQARRAWSMGWDNWGGGEEGRGGQAGERFQSQGKKKKRGGDRERDGGEDEWRRRRQLLSILLASCNLSWADLWPPPYSNCDACPLCVQVEMPFDVSEAKSLPSIHNS